jgi:hypothetical protein
MTAFKIQTGVGGGQKNRAEDVAFIQMALKVIPKGKFKRTSLSSYWPGRIDGKYSFKIRDAIAIFKDQYFTEEELNEPNLLKEPLGGFSSANSKAYKRLISALPSKYKNVNYRFGKIADRTVVLQVGSGSSGKINFTPAELALPNADAERLIKHLNLIASAYKIVPTIEQITAGYNGHLYVHVGLNGGKIIDAETARIIEFSAQKRSDILAFLRMTFDNPIFPKTGRYWELISAEKVIFKTTLGFDFLRASKVEKTWARYQLGAHETRMQADVVEKVLAAYERFRIGAELKPATEKMMIELLGDDWKKIKEKVALKEARAHSLCRKLKKATAARDFARASLLLAENNFRASLGIKKRNVLGELVEDAEEYFIGRILKVGGTKALRVATKGRLKGGPIIVGGKVTNTVNLTEDLAGDAVASALGGEVTDIIPTPPAEPNDKTDNLLSTLSYIALAIVVVGLVIATGGLALGGAAALSTLAVGGEIITVGLLAGRLVDAANLAKVGLDALESQLFNMGLERELFLLNQEIRPARIRFDNTNQNLTEIMALLGAAKIALVDCGFTPDQISAAQKELAAIS